MFQALKDGLNGEPKILPYPTDIYKHIDNTSRPWFVSLYQYNEGHKIQIEKAKSFKGIEDTTTDRLFLDLDSKTDLNKAQSETKQLIEKLINDGFDDSSLKVFFSGQKGFSIEIDLTDRLTPTQVKTIIKTLAKEFSCLDVKVTDPVRIIRVANTKHDSGLYKIPLDIDEILNLNIEQIKELAKQPRTIQQNFTKATLPNSYKTISLVKPKSNKINETAEPIDFSKKPREWRNCKWALLQGNFQSGERHSAMTIIAATTRGLGYDKETAYYLCKSAIKKQARLFKQEEFSTDEIWENILESIYAKDWKGGQYSCKSDLWLQKYCDGLGEHSCKDRNQTDGHSCVKVGDMHSQFKDYAINFESNIIKTGITKLDDNVMLCASTLNGLLGAPGAGKTTMALNYLRNASISGVSSIFLSLDMGMPIVFAKLVQQKSGLDFKAVLQLFKNNPQRAEKYVNDIKEEHKLVDFNFTAGIKVEDINTIINQNRANTGLSPKLVVIDYLECIAGEYSDPLASAGIIANKLKDIANSQNVCILLLLQTQKHSTPDISDPLLSIRQIKGSSVLEQSMTTVITLWRDGYNPETIQNDRYISFAVVKNRLGSQWKGDFSWDGVSGTIRELTSEEEFSLDEFRAEKRRKKELKAKEQDGAFFS